MRNHLESDSIRALPPIPSAIVVRIRRGRELKEKSERKELVTEE